MAVHFPSDVLQKARERGHVPCCIAVGKVNVHFFPGNHEAQILLLQMIQADKDRELQLQASLQLARESENETLPIPGMEEGPKIPLFHRFKSPEPAPKRSKPTKGIKRRGRPPLKKS